MDLLASDPSLKFCRAVWKVAAEARGSKEEIKTRYERLRKKYNRLKKLGQLPAAASSVERKAAAVAEHYARRHAAIEKARAELASAEAKAVSLDLDLSQDLEGLGVTLRRRREFLTDLLSEPPDWLMGRFLNDGVKDPDEAKQKLYAADEEMRLVERQLEALEAVRRLRDIARMGS